MDKFNGVDIYWKWGIKEERLKDIFVYCFMLVCGRRVELVLEIKIKKVD